MMTVIIPYQNALINMAKLTKLLRPNADFATRQLEYLPNAKVKRTGMGFCAQSCYRNGKLLEFQKFPASERQLLHGTTRSTLYRFSHEEKEEMKQILNCSMGISTYSKE